MPGCPCCSWPLPGLLLSAARLCTAREPGQIVNLLPEFHTRGPYPLCRLPGAGRFCPVRTTESAAQGTSGHPATPMDSLCRLSSHQASATLTPSGFSPKLCSCSSGFALRAALRYQHRTSIPWTLNLLPGAWPCSTLMLPSR